MKKIKVLAILPYEGLKKIVTDIANQYEQICLTAVVGDLGAGVALASHASEDGYDVILSRGGTAQMIMDTVSIPVISIDVSGYDIFRVIRLAKNYSGKSALVGFPNITHGAKIICELLQTDLNIQTIHSEEEAIAVLDALCREGYSVIIGDTVTIRLAQERGLNGILLTSGPESVKNAFDELIKICSYINESQSKSSFLKRIIDGAPDASLVFSENGLIIHKSCHQIPDELVKRLEVYIDHVMNNGYIKILTESNLDTWSVTGNLIHSDDDTKYAAFYIKKLVDKNSEKYNGVRFINRNDNPLFFNYAVKGKLLSDIIKQAKEYEKSNRPILITGEYGTGKSTIAYTIHLNSKRNINTFIFLNCEYIGTEQWKEILSGKYASFVDINGCDQYTFYLHRIDALSKAAQKLLLSYFLPGRDSILPHIIASSITPLEAFVNKGAFCGELLNRMSFLNINIPPLRDRKEEIKDLVSIFISKYNEKYGKQLVGIDGDALELLKEQYWEGNIDQLEKITEEMVILCDGQSLSIKEAKRVLENSICKKYYPEGKLTVSLDKDLDSLTSEIIAAVLEKEGMNQSRAAEILGISRSTLWRKLKSK
ncbi:MAG: PrpR N-terminal domain-containing protein [Bacillota bacterium]